MTARSPHIEKKFLKTRVFLSWINNERMRMSCWCHFKALNNHKCIHPARKRSHCSKTTRINLSSSGHLFAWRSDSLRLTKSVLYGWSTQVYVAYFLCLQLVLSENVTYSIKILTWFLRQQMLLAHKSPWKQKKISRKILQTSGQKFSSTHVANMDILVEMQKTTKENFEVLPFRSQLPMKTITLPFHLLVLWHEF